MVAHDVRITDKELNIYEIKRINYDLKNKEIYGKDVQINSNNTLLTRNHLARSKSRSIVINKDYATLKKSVYTNCKKRDGCPPWLIVSEDIIHDKKTKL